MKPAWMLLALCVGCSQPPAPTAPAPPPEDMVRAVLADEVPPPPQESPLGAAVGAYLDQAAADAEVPRVRVTMLTAAWCVNCPNAKKKIVPWLQAKGYEVEIVDVGDGHDLQDGYGVSSIPAFVFTLGDKSTAVVGPRYDTKGNVYAPDFAKALAAFPPPDKNAVSFGMSVPAISVADLTEGVAGMDQDLFGVVHVTVPKDVSWTVTKKAASVLLTFKEGKQPSLRALKYVRANPSLVSVEVSPYWAEFKTDSWWPMLKAVRVEFDWAPPVAVVKKTAGVYYARHRPYPYRYPQQPYKPVPQKAKPVTDPEPTPAPPEPIKLGKSVPVIVPVAHAWRASICVWVKRERTVVDFFGIQSVQEGKGCGSGMIVSPQGHLLTCAHVVDGVKSIEVEFCDGQKRPATVVESDSKTDLAILKVAGVDLPVVAWAAELPMIGADAYMIGNPHGRGESVARGVVAGFNRETESEDYKHSGLVQFSIAINPGNSGGPIVNSKGDVLGVINAMVGDHAGLDAQGIAFAIPTSTAKAFVDRVVK